MGTLSPWPCAGPNMPNLITVTRLEVHDPTVPPVIQCDASMNGLGACLLQNNHPVAYASRSLTQPETHYAQIEKEMLAIMFGMLNRTTNH
jgi:hypothetical protein